MTQASNSSQNKVVGIVVARMGSTRVPGKSVMELAGQPVLWHVIQAALRIEGVDEVCLATTDLGTDDPLVELARGCGIGFVRGDPEMVLDRVHLAAETYGADIIVDIGGDCPLLDPGILSAALQDFFAKPCDYLCNYDPPTFPEGMDVNILTRAALDRAYHEALAPSQRIHPFSYLTRHPNEFKIRNYAMSPDLSHHHWSLDFPEDVDFLKAVFERAWRPGHVFSTEEILGLIAHDGEIAALDKAIQKPKVLHAFWNSPGIIRDMNRDIVHLCEMAQRSLEAGDRGVAKRCYDEVLSIAQELARQAGHASDERT